MVKWKQRVSDRRDTDLGAVAEDHQSTNDEDKHELKSRNRKHHIEVLDNITHKQICFNDRQQRGSAQVLWVKIKSDSMLIPTEIIKIMFCYILESKWGQDLRIGSIWMLLSGMLTLYTVK